MSQQEQIMVICATLRRNKIFSSKQLPSTDDPECTVNLRLPSSHDFGPLSNVLPLKPAMVSQPVAETL
jgi:hypothetical protein